MCKSLGLNRRALGNSESRRRRSVQRWPPQSPHLTTPPPTRALQACVLSRMYSRLVSERCGLTASAYK